MVFRPHLAELARETFAERSITKQVTARSGVQCVPKTTYIVSLFLSTWFLNPVVYRDSI
jgi:uncharacterized membrane protein